MTDRYCTPTVGIAKKPTAASEKVLLISVEVADEFVWQVFSYLLGYVTTRFADDAHTYFA